MNYDLAAERDLAITLACNSAAWDYVGDTLTPAMFGGEQARGAFEAVRALVKKCRPVTPVTVAAELAAAGKANSAVPSWATLPRLSVEEAQVIAARIRELWARRTLAAVASQAATSADRPSTETAAALAEGLEAVTTGGPGKAQPIARLVLDWLSETTREAQSPTARLVSYETGFETFDRTTGGLRMGELAVFAARPGSGKSSWVMALATNLAAAGIPVGLFWLEDDWRDAVRRFLARRFKADAWRLRGHPRLALGHIETFADLPAKVELPLYVDDAHGLTITDLQARMRRLHREHGVRVFILDHLGEVRIEKDERWGDRHDLALGRVARVYRDTAKDLGAVPILVSQMNRRIEQRDDGTPRMSDLDGSGQVEQAARLIAFVRMERGDDGSPTGRGSLDVVKNSGGQVGRIPLAWDSNAMTWREG